MVDVPGDTTTGATIIVGSTVENQIDFVGDHDWFRVSLTAGQKISIALNGVGLEDPYLYLRNASGAVLAENDDGGGARNSRLVFTAPTTGTYYIDASAWVNNGSDPDYTGTGAYKLTVSNYVLPSVGTLDQFAYQMTNGFFGGQSQHFAVTQGGTITVDLSALTDAGRAVAREALQQWSDIIGVNFVEQTGGAQIGFDDLEVGTGAHADTVVSNGIITSATVNVALSRLHIHTYMHEIAHALGLGHTSNSNAGTAAAIYPQDAIWSNDGSAISIMSYFDNAENAYYADQGFSNAQIRTPQVADIIAMGNLYGLSTATRLDDTTYGFNNTSGRTAYDATQYPNISYTIFDSGGTDTLDYSGFANNQLINLNPEAFSNIGALVGNVVIARGTIIENAIGGSGNDTIIGNAANNSLTGGNGNDVVFAGAGNDVVMGGLGDDTLVGGDGNDTLYGQAGVDTLTGGAGLDIFVSNSGDLSGDTINDFEVGDQLLFVGVDASTFTYSLSGSTLTFSGGSLTLPGVTAPLVSNQTGSNGLVQLSLQADVRNDFNGDGRSDILWRDGSGTLSEWLAQADGSFAWNPASNYSIPANWTLMTTGDFNNDGRDDILWRDTAGVFSQWLAQANGSFAWNANATYTIPSSWTLVSTGDFNKDGRDDILWRDGAGTLSQWLGQSNGSFAWNPNATYSVAPSWTLAGTGDFNNDGRDDILWRDGAGTLSEWLGQTDGSFAWNAAAVYQVATTSILEDTGDFNRDGYDDILWRDGSGTLSEWLGQAGGSFAWNPGAVYQTPTSWKIETTGDFNRDGFDEILWRDGNGTLSQWLGGGSGGFAWNPAAVYQTPTSWHVQPDTIA